MDFDEQAGQATAKYIDKVRGRSRELELRRREAIENYTQEVKLLNAKIREATEAVRFVVESFDNELARCERTIAALEPARAKLMGGGGL